VTGDIAYSGTAGQYKTAKTWLLDLAKPLKLADQREADIWIKRGTQRGGVFTPMSARLLAPGRVRVRASRGRCATDSISSPSS
jgi:hypothetical protein